LIRLDDLNLED